MNDSHSMSDGPLLGAMRDMLSDVPLPARPPLEVIVTRGRTRRRRRRAKLSVGGIATGAALALALAGVITSPSPVSGRPARLAAYSIVSNPDGTTTLTLNAPADLRDPEVVRQALAEHGIPALVTVGKFCTTHVVLEAPGAISLHGHSIVFYPAAMPAWLEVSIGYLPDNHDLTLAVALIDTRAPLTCGTIVPQAPNRVPIPHSA